MKAYIKINANQYRYYHFIYNLDYMYNVLVSMLLNM